MRKLAAYDELADEYYDSDLHPTCANFSTASILILANWLSRHVAPTICDVGAGRSVVAALAAKRILAPTRIVLLDVSANMLTHTRYEPASLLVADAAVLPLRSGCADTLVCSLGDPYNVASFWSEAARVCTDGGTLMFTTPSHEWSVVFRDAEGAHHAEFVTASGQRVLVPSLIVPEEEQVAMAHAAGFELRALRAVRASELGMQLSPKLADTARRDEPIVTGYRFEKASHA